MNIVKGVKDGGGCFDQVGHRPSKSHGKGKLATILKPVA